MAESQLAPPGSPDTSRARRLAAPIECAVNDAARSTAERALRVAGTGSYSVLAD